MTAVLTSAIAEKFAALALAHVGREYPNKMDHVLASPADIIGPRDAHPIFFGSFDWHSCVHGYWLLAQLLRLYPNFAHTAAITTLFEHAITPEKVAAECAYLERPQARGFERPYGWAWALALQAEFDRHEQGPGKQAAETLRPLATAFAARFAAFLPLSTYPVRTGVHSSTAFALRLAADYVEARDPPLFSLMRDKTRAWYGADQGAQAWEPSQDDFLSPTLMEAECMRRFTPAAEFRAWFARFLPHADRSEPAVLFRPASVSDRSDGKIAHLDGLNLSRAWCWRALASAHPADSALSIRAREAAEHHINASLPHVAGDYMGEHWLASFALLALTA
ncbi:MAG: DUF2891 domain-containing protein [Hyphomonadaceae bacterium]|nr:DUF2891 domain-containing protein [Hyphomonadaceae bacterium]